MTNLELENILLKKKIEKSNSKNYRHQLIVSLVYPTERPLLKRVRVSDFEISLAGYFAIVGGKKPQKPIVARGRQQLCGGGVDVLQSTRELTRLAIRGIGDL